MAASDEIGPQSGEQVFASIKSLTANIRKVIVGKSELIELLVAAFLARGHVLLEDKPGVGKTVLARALAKSIAGCSFKRIQCTPDLLPVDITGYVDPRSGSFKPGPVFANIVLADELNRATPRTQSALLEAMAEGQVTIDGETHRLPEPFFVIATQNPIEHRGVNDLPEAQLDRFQVLLSPGYPSENEERQLMLERLVRDPLDEVSPVLDLDSVHSAIVAARRVKLADQLVHYIVRIVRATRDPNEFEFGASPRSALQLMALSQAFALVNGRTYVIPDDIKVLTRHVLPHRVVPSAAFEESYGTLEWKRKSVEAAVKRVKLTSNE